MPVLVGRIPAPDLLAQRRHYQPLRKVLAIGEDRFLQKVRLRPQVPIFDKDARVASVISPHIRAHAAFSLQHAGTYRSRLRPKPKVRHGWDDAAKQFHYAGSSRLAGMKDECKRICSDIFIYLGESLLNNVAKYSLHFLSSAEPVILHPGALQFGR